MYKQIRPVRRPDDWLVSCDGDLTVHECRQGRSNSRDESSRMIA
jgi:hypothetical protein